MLPKTQRLTRARDFHVLGVKGRPIFGPFLTLRVRQTVETQSRVAFITSTKVMKRAVDRNRAKRRMRAIIRDLMPEIPLKLHLMFILKPECATLPFEVLVAEVKRLLGKIPEALTKPAKISPGEIKRRAKIQAKRNQTGKP